MSSFSDIVRKSRHSSINELLDSFNRAAAVGDLNAYFGCFYNASSRFLGTDSSENWTAPDFFEFAKPYFDGANPAWEYIPISGSRRYEIFSATAGSSGEPAPLFATFDELLESKSFPSTCRGSGTLCFEGGYWFVCAYHLTFPIPNDIAKDMTKTIGKYEKESKIRAEATEADRHAAELLEELELEEDQKPPSEETKVRRGKTRGGAKKK